MEIIEKEELAETLRGFQTYSGFSSEEKDIILEAVAKLIDTMKKNGDGQLIDMRALFEKITAPGMLATLKRIKARERNT